MEREVKLEFQGFSGKEGNLINRFLINNISKEA